MEGDCGLKCQTAMTADYFLVRTKLLESSAQVFAAAHCGLVYDAIDFGGMVNDMVKF